MIDISYGDTAADIERKLLATLAPAPANLEARIRAACGTGRWTSLATLRAQMADVSRADMDQALRSLNRQHDVVMIPEDNQKALRPADRDAALWVGDQPKHYLAIGLR